MNNILPCPQCHRPLPSSRFTASESLECPSCGREFEIDVFPAFFAPIRAGKVGEEVVIDSEASCFYHPQKKAVIPCDNCGRFLCALCDMEFNAQHLCPACLESGREKGALKHLDNQRTLYDNIALRISLYPIILFFLWFLTIITAPITLFVAIRYWNAPSSILPRTKVRFIVAILVACLQLFGWIYYIWLLVRML